MIFTCPGGDEQRVAAPNREGDHFSAVVAQLPRDFREEPIVAHHQSHFAEARAENRVLFAWGDAPLDFRARQRGLPVLAEHPPVRSGQDRHIIDQVAVALDESHDDINVMLPREHGEIVRGRSWNGLRRLGVRQAGTADSDRLRQNHEVGVLARRFLNERREQAAILRRGLFARRPEVHGRQTHLAGRRRVGLGQGNFAPFNLRSRGPAQMHLHDRARGL